MNKQISGLEADLKQFKSDLASKDQGWTKVPNPVEQQGRKHRDRHFYHENEGRGGGGVDIWSGIGIREKN